MSDFVPSSDPEDQKRRSSRIVQAVPLTVTGVDALGRPFQERTSTLIINCHGCRYQSKHYVLKNMWVTLSVPHPEPNREPRTARARVMWIRRPHTVRELFQIGVELETPGNLWGIAFLPPDWFPFPDVPLPPSPTVSEIHLDSSAEAPAAEETLPEEAADNLRTMPLGGGNDPALLLARQMNRLVTEAKQQLQVAVRESAAQAVSAEAGPLIAALQSQIRDAARQSVETVAEKAVQETVERNARASETQLAQLREFWNRQLSESAEQAQHTWSARIEETERQLRAAFSQDLQNQSRQAIQDLDQASREFQERLSRAQENLAGLAQGVDNAAAPFVQGIEQRLRSQSDEVRAQLDELQQASGKWREEMNAAALAAETVWRARLDDSIRAAESRWNEQFETSLDSAVQQAAERLSRRSQETAEQMEREAGVRIASMGRALLEAGTEAEQKIGALRATFDAQATRSEALLTRVEGATREIEGHIEQLDAVEHAVWAEMERRGTALLETQAQKLDQRAEAALTTWTSRFEPTLESAGRQVVARLGAELEEQLNTRLERVGHALGELQNQSQAVEQGLGRHAESLKNVSEQEIKAALERLGASIGRLEQDLQESSRNATAKWIAEIDTKATEMTHTTFESLFKTAEWYEKKVQTQMHNTLEKGLEQAHDSLRDKAGEISRLFAAEMDHYSRSYVEHTHEQIEEAGRQTLGGVQKQAADLSASATNAIAQHAQNQTDSALQQFRSRAEGVLNQISSQLEALSGQARSTLDAELQQSQVQFRDALTQSAHEALRGSSQEIRKEVESAKETVRAEGRRETGQLQQALHSLHDQAVESYRRRLEATSDTWILTTVTKLNQQSQQQLEALARSAEARLRETCTQVFSSVGESLRRRLLDVALQPLSEKPPAKPPTKPDDPSLPVVSHAPQAQFPPRS